MKERPGELCRCQEMFQLLPGLSAVFGPASLRLRPVLTERTAPAPEVERRGRASRVVSAGGGDVDKVTVDWSAQLLLLRVLTADGLPQGLLLPDDPLLQGDVGQDLVPESADCPGGFPAGQGAVIAGRVTDLLSLG